MPRCARLLCFLFAVASSCEPGSEQPAGFKEPPARQHEAAQTIELLGTVNGQNGQPIAQAEIRIAPLWRSARTDAAGQFRLSLKGPRPEPIHVFVSAPGHAVWGKRIVLAHGAKEQRLVIQLETEARLSGQLLDQDGHPIVGAPLVAEYLAEVESRKLQMDWLRVHDAEAGFGLGQAATDEAGRFALSGLPAGDWQIRFPRGGESAWWESRAYSRLDLSAGDHALVLREGEGLFDFHGQVIDSRDGTALGGVSIAPQNCLASLSWVSVGDGHVQTSAAEDGRFVLRGLPGTPNEWRVGLHRDGFVRETSESLRVSSPEKPRVFGLAPPREAEVRVIDSLGKPVYGAAILSLGVNGSTGVGKPFEMLSRASDRNGRISLREVPAAVTKIWIWSHWRCSPESQTVDFSLPETGEPPVLEVQLEGDHSSPRFAIPIRIDPKWLVDPEARFLVEARDESGHLIGEWSVRATPHRAHAYEVHLGGSSWSIWPRIGQLEEPSFAGLLPIGAVQFSARQGDKSIAGPQRTIVATGDNEGVVFSGPAAADPEVHSASPDRD